MTYEAIMNDLSRKKYAPCYLLTGEEPFFIDQVTSYIEKNALQEDEKSFNQAVFYGKDTEMETVIHTAKQYPMMAAHQVVIVKEAQLIKKGWDALAEYVENPQESTVLVINYKKKFDKRQKLFKVAEKKGVTLESAKLYENKVPAWINSYTAQMGYSIEPQAALMLVEFLGIDLSKIAGELQKLSIVIPKTVKRITPEHIEKNIGISKDYNVFELQNALSKKNILKANRIIDYFGKNPNATPMVMVITVLFSFYTKLLQYHFAAKSSPTSMAATLGVNPYFLKDYEEAARLYSPEKIVQIMHELRSYDIRAKGGEGTASTSSTELLKELIFKILH